MLAMTNAQLGFYEGAWEKGARIRRDHVIVARITHALLTAGALAFWPCVVMRGLGTQLSAPRFCALWAFIWLSMTTFGLVIAMLLRVFGATLGNLLHLVFLILNLVSSGSIAPQELMPPFYQVGFALPFFNAVQGTRTIMFGSYDRLGRNIGVQFAWIGLVLAVAGRAAVRHRAALAAQAARAAA